MTNPNKSETFCSQCFELLLPEGLCQSEPWSWPEITTSVRGGHEFKNNLLYPKIRFLSFRPSHASLSRGKKINWNRLDCGAPKKSTVTQPAISHRLSSVNNSADGRLLPPEDYRLRSGCPKILLLVGTARGPSGRDDANRPPIPGIFEKGASRIRPRLSPTIRPSPSVPRP